MSSESFGELIAKVRQGDTEATAELVRRYEPAIRRSLRLRLDPRMRRTCDSVDISQAVLCSFFSRAAAGQFEIDSPENLVKLLSTMARNKLTKTRRDQYRDRRDSRRVADGSPDDHGAMANNTSPSRQAAARELLAELRRRLSEEERRLVDLRSHGHDWAAIAAAVDGGPEAVRKKHSRAVARVAAELGLDSDMA